MTFSECHLKNSKTPRVAAERFAICHKNEEGDSVISRPDTPFYGVAGGKVRACAGKRNAPLFKHISAVGNRKRLARVLLHQQDRCAGSMEFADDVENLLHKDRRKAHGRFIQHKQLRVAHHRAAHGKHLLLASGKRACNLLFTLLQAREAAEHILDVRIGDLFCVYAPMSRFSRTVICRKMRLPSGTCASPRFTSL